MSPSEGGAGLGGDLDVLTGGDDQRADQGTTGADVGVGIRVTLLGGVLVDVHAEEAKPAAAPARTTGSCSPTPPVNTNTSSPLSAAQPVHIHPQSQGGTLVTSTGRLTHVTQVTGTLRQPGQARLVHQAAATPPSPAYVRRHR